MNSWVLWELGMSPWVENQHQRWRLRFSPTTATGILTVALSRLVTTDRFGVIWPLTGCGLKSLRGLKAEVLALFYAVDAQFVPVCPWDKLGSKGRKTSSCVHKS